MLRRLPVAAFSSAIALAFAAAPRAQHDEVPRSPRLTVFVVAAKGAPRTEALLTLLRTADVLPRVVDCAACAPELLRTADVVLVDWPADAKLGDASPLGPLARWDRPTVFVGACGDRIAQQWSLPTAAAIAAMAADERGPEMQERRDGRGAKAVVWRQGHLFHFASDGEPATWPERERQWLLHTVEQAARFASDRPIVRCAAPAGSELPAAERERRERVAAACQQLGVAAADREALLALPSRRGADGADRKLVTRLLTDLVPDSCDVDTTPNNWSNWLRPRANALVFDPLSRVWRVDLLAHWRGVASATCRGDLRADGDAERDPAAQALAAKVALRHGGPALADLATFSCWLGELHVAWDRRAGVFRMENHATLAPGARATAWQVSVIDTAADAEILWGGGPPPRPRVSARGTWRDVVEQVFLPAMLLQPAVSLRRVPEQDDGDARQALGVRLGGRGMDPRTEHVLLVDVATGDVVRMLEQENGRVQRDVEVVARTQCGPLLLPTELTAQRRNGPVRTVVADARWNPDLPATLATATERLSEPRGR